MRAQPQPAVEQQIACSICERTLDPECPEWQWRIETCGSVDCIDKRIDQLLRAENKWQKLSFDIGVALEHSGRKVIAA